MNHVTAEHVVAYNPCPMMEGKMARSRKTKTEQDSEGGFQQSILTMLEWLAERDPVRAASIVGAYLDELAEEMGNSPTAAAKG